MSDTYLEIQKGQITTITLKSPKGLNLLQVQTISELTQLFKEIKTDPEIHAVIITGGEAKAFCAGADMNELQALHTDVPQYVEQGQALMESIYHCPVPVIAAINGYALGAGFSLAMACDLRLLSTQAKIGQLAVRNSLVPPFGNIQHLIQAVGSLKTRELIYTGRILVAEDAYRIGIVNQTYAPEELLSEAQRWAEDICLSPSHVIKMVKDIVNRTLEEGHAVGYLVQEDKLIDTLSHPSSQERLNQFLTKPREK